MTKKVNKETKTKSAQSVLLPLIDVTKDVNAPEIVLSKEIQRQIAFCHMRIGGVEWSGTLIYKFRNAKDSLSTLYDKRKKEPVVIDAHKFLLRDIGTGASTEFDLSTEEQMEEADYVIGNPAKGIEAGHRCGLIHTHHDMGTYFSAVDIAELKTNTPNHEVYVSLIVNYKDGGSPIARMCWKGTREMEAKTNDSFSFKAKKKKVSATAIKEQDVIFYTDLIMKVDIESEISDKLDAIQEAKVKADAKKSTYSYNAKTVKKGQANETGQTEIGFNKTSNIVDKEIFRRPNYTKAIAEADAELDKINIKTSFPRDYQSVSKALVRWVSGNKKDERMFYKVAKDSKLGPFALDILEDKLSDTFDEVCDEFNEGQVLLEWEQIIICYLFLGAINTVQWKDNELVQKVIGVLDDIGLELLEEIDPRSTQVMWEPTDSTVEEEHIPITRESLKVGDVVLVQKKDSKMRVEGVILEKPELAKDRVQVKYVSGSIALTLIRNIMEVTRPSNMERLQKDIEKIGKDLGVCEHCKGVGVVMGYPCYECKSEEWDKQHVSSSLVS